MITLFYVGFNGYQQCPNDGKTILPKVIHKWEEFSLKNAKDVVCTFRNVVVKTENNFLIYGLANEGNDVNYRTINFPVHPKAFLATDDYLYVSESNNIWKSQFDDKWSHINFLHSNKELLLWNQQQIIKLCYIHNKPQIIILSSDGTVWRLNADDELSIVMSPTLDRATDISSGFEHVLILTESGCVMTFGNGSHGQLGHGDLDPVTEPLQVLALGGLKVVKISAAGWHSSAVTDSGDLYMWGWNNFGQISEIKQDCSSAEADKYEMTPLPMLVDIDENKEVNIKDIACGVRHTVIITDTNEIFSTGWNEYGQLGIDDTSLKKANKFMNVTLPAGKGKKQLRCGPWSTLVYEENEICFSGEPPQYPSKNWLDVFCEAGNKIRNSSQEFCIFNKLKYI